MSRPPRVRTVLSSEQRELFLRRLRENGVAAGADRRIPRRAPDRPVPLTAAQQRLWFFEQLNPGNPAYNDVYGIRFEGRLDVGVLQEALAHLVGRHESLRTTVDVSSGTPVQQVGAGGHLAMPLVDISSLPVAELGLRLEALARDVYREPFDLAQGPLIRALLVRSAPAEHNVLLVVHHIVLDGESFLILFRELGELYRAFLEGRPSPLPELAIQYADFAVWEQDRLNDESLGPALAYWREQLRPPLPRAALPGDRQRPDVQTFRGAGCDWTLPAPLEIALASLARENDSTLFMTLLAAFQVLLRHWTGQDDMLIGFSISNRPTQLEGVFGMFVNTSVFRADLSGNPTFLGLLARTRRTCLAAYAHPQLPLEKLIGSMKIPRNLGRNPLFDVFVLQHRLPGAVELPGVRMSNWPVDSVAAKLDLELWIMDEAAEGPTAGGRDPRDAKNVTVRLQHNRDVLDESTGLGLLRQYELVVRAILESPDRTLADLARMLSEPDEEAKSARRDLQRSEHLGRLKRARRTPVTSAQSGQSTS